MKADYMKRLEALERKSTDWIAKLDYIDYLGIEDYDNGKWLELHHENPLAIVRHRQTGEIRAHYSDRRTMAEINAHGNSAYL